MAPFKEVMEAFDISPEKSMGPLIESVFYAELAARSILAVENIKRGESEIIPNMSSFSFCQTTSGPSSTTPSVQTSRESHSSDPRRCHWGLNWMKRR